jgi:hypothetical protein
METKNVIFLYGPKNKILQLYRDQNIFNLLFNIENRLLKQSLNIFLIHVPKKFLSNYELINLVP